MNVLKFARMTKHDCKCLRFKLREFGDWDKISLSKEWGSGFLTCENF